jgi:translation initiation factor 2 alpha subunit (eIF-2alpha)
MSKNQSYREVWLPRVPEGAVFFMELAKRSNPYDVKRRVLDNLLKSMKQTSNQDFRDYCEHVFWYIVENYDDIYELKSEQKN